MGEITLLPSNGAVFFDARNDGRSLRVSWHEPDQIYVVSIWRDESCVATFRLSRDEAPRLLFAMTSALAGDGDGPATADSATG
jgi:hypothetical protein